MRISPFPKLFVGLYRLFDSSFPYRKEVNSSTFPLSELLEKAIIRSLLFPVIHMDCPLTGMGELYGFSVQIEPFVFLSIKFVAYDGAMQS